MIIRRIVTGHDARGKSVFLSDGPAPRAKAFEGTPGFVSNPLWTTRRSRTGQGQRCRPDSEGRFAARRTGGSVLIVVTFPPDSVMASLDMETAWPEHLAELPGIAERFEPDAPGMHRTDTLDYAIILSGEISVELDDGAQKHLVAGDVVVQQGVRHAWRNNSAQPATIAFCMLGRS